MSRLPEDVTRRRRVVAATLAGIGLLFGGVACGSDDEPTGEEVGGDRISGNGYSLEAPDGWTDEGEFVREQMEASAGSIDLAIAAEPSAEFTTNFNVVRVTPPPTQNLDQLAQLLTQEVTPLAEGEVTPVDQVDIDGTPAVGHELESSTGGELHFLRQYSTIHDDAVYTMTMSASRDEADAAVETMDEIIASWTWETPTT